MKKQTYQTFSTRKTPQSEPIPGSSQIPNSAGGYAWGLNDWDRLDRFLILGSEGGTYYIKERQLTKENAQAVLRCIQDNGKRVVDQIVAISDAGRAAKNDPALFALAMCAGLGDAETKTYALEALPKVARIGTHLFHFATYVEQFRGWGRGLRNAIANWYTQKSADQVAFQAVKYQQRDGWSHRDLLRLSHPTPADNLHQATYRWITQDEMLENVPKIIEGFEKAKRAENAKEIVSLIAEYNLPREAIPTQFLNEPTVWDAMLPTMPLTATIRNLGKMTSIDVLKPMSENARMVIAKLSDEEYIRKSRVHPLAILVALKTYQQGQGMRGSLNWNPVSQIVDALDKAFYLSFGNVEPTGKRIMLALDVSSSMIWGNIAGMPISAGEGASAMALITANVEQNYLFMGFAHNFRKLTISPRQRLDDVIAEVYGHAFGGTDCSLPMIYANQHNLEIDAFVVYTDSETWVGRIHPSQALVKYREKTGIPAKLIVVGMESNGFTIANPNDKGMLDVVGFDTATPNVISEFIRN